jgi:hypothetical protein
MAGIRTAVSLHHRSHRHWTAVYIRDRLKLFLHELSRPGEPWLTAAMVDFLSTWLKPSDIGMEWGSGASTRWFATRVSHLISIEADKHWFSKIDKLLDKEALREKVTYLYYPKDNPLYHDQVSALPDRYLDFCLVDGEHRDDCAIRALDKLKPGGLMIVDNVNWYIPRDSKSRAPNSRRGSDFASERWRDFATLVASWRCVWTTNGVTDTAAWIRPS